MTSELRTLAIVLLNGKNYPTWEVLCRMALMRDGIWDIVSGNENVRAKEEAGNIRSSWLESKRSRSGYYGVVNCSIIVVFDWRIRRSLHCMGENL